MNEIIDLSCSSLKVLFDTHTLDIKVSAGNKEWIQNNKSLTYMELNYKDGEVKKVFFNDALKVLHEPWKSGVGKGLKSEYDGFEIGGHIYSIVLRTLVWIDDTYNDLHFELTILEEDQNLIKKIVWPGPFEFNCKNGNNYTVLPMRQGILIPNNWPEKVETVFDSRFYTMGLYMPWWGQIEGENGYIAIAETPWDGGCDLDHPAGGPTAISPIWYPSLGKISYRRRMKYSFVKDCDYNDLCKIYRKHVIQQGEFFTLRQKALRNNNINRIIGSNIVTDFVCIHIKPESMYYKKDNPEYNDRIISFETRADQLKRLKHLGADKVYFHLDGWGRRGYDNLHPDILPPCEKAGGWDGMKKLSDICEELGYILAIHDEYYNFYTDSESYNTDQVICDEKGDTHAECVWFGGEQALLCTQLAPYYLRRNFEIIKKHGLKLEGAYLDGFSAAPLYECFHSEHKMSRKECMEKRKECFEFVHSEGLLVSSEEAVDCVLPEIDLVHHAPYAMDNTFDKGNPRGIPVPLFNLVYHECLVVPWSTGKGGAGIPQSDSGFLHALLNGGVPYLSIEADEVQISRNRTLCELHQCIGMQEMVRHEFVDGNLRIQKTYFEDGTTICVNFDTEEFDIKKEQA